MFKDTNAFSGFSVDDLDAAREFYGETLGIQLSDEGPGLGLELATGGSVFIYPKGDDHEPATFTVLNFPVGDIEAAVEELAERGVSFERYDWVEQDERGIAAPPHGPRIAWFKDPAGNVLSVLSEST
jgi:catechol 2,3-dioxygenase-like lactoylglutathione lyase family enzyme